MAPARARAGRKATTSDRPTRCASAWRRRAMRESSSSPATSTRSSARFSQERRRGAERLPGRAERPLNTPADPSPKSRVGIDIPWRTIFKLLAALVLVWLWLLLWQWILLLVVAVFLALGLDPLVSWLDQHRFRRTYSAPVVVLALAALLVLFGYFAGGELID